MRKLREASSLLGLLLLALLSSGPAVCQQPAINVTKGEIDNQNSSLDAVGAQQPLQEPLTERLVKQSNLQAEESRSEAAISVLPAPSGLGSGQQQPLGPVSFRGGSGNSYLSMSRDGSNRYEFGFDTVPHSAEVKQTEPVQVRPAGKAPRLMREESRLADGTVIGRYGYTDPFNVFRIVQYVAGADGYFASEHVGGLVDESPLGGSKFQLNKQLHKALKQVRSRRRSTDAPVTPAAQPEPQLRSRVEAGDLGSSDSQPIRFSTTINHLVGTNGLSYATAFRPTPLQRPSRTVPLRSANLYEPVRSPSPVELLQSQHEQLRSKLPAPIYSPLSQYSFAVAHSAPEVEYPQPEPPQWQPVQQVVAQQPSANVLQASPAWNVLSNNYNSDQLNLLIDHQAASSAISSPAANLGGQVGAQIDENFKREAAILKSVQQRQQQVPAPARQEQPVILKPVQQSQQQVSLPTRQEQPVVKPNPFGMAYDYSRQQARPAAFGARTGGHWSQQYGLALNQFNPPLYHPDVHEQAGGNTAPVSVYSSTIVHDQASERQLPPDSDILLRSSSESRPVSSPVPVAAQAKEANKPQVVAATQSANVEPVRYATRLTSLSSGRQRALTDELDMLMEQSELSAVYSTNGTTSGSRAKLPDRSKKLSSIFKARTSHLADESEASTGPRIRRPMPVSMKKQSSAAKKLIEPSVDTPSLSSQQVDTQGGGQPLDQQQDSRANKTNKVSTSKKFGSLAGPKAEVLIEEVPVSAAKKRPVLRPESVVIEPVAEPVQQTSSTTARPSSTTTTSTTTTSTTTTTTAAPTTSPALLLSKSVGPEEPAAVSTIIDVTNQSGEELKSSLDRELYEKIVRIQQEIAAKSFKQSVPEPTPTTTEPHSSSTSTSTSTSTTPIPTTRAPEETQRPSTTTTSTTRAPPTTMEPIKTRQEFLTGPVIAMSDPMMDQADFLSKLDIETNSFDSARDLQTSEANRINSSRLVTTTTPRPEVVKIATTTTTAQPEPSKVPTTTTSAAPFAVQDPSATPDAALNLTADSILIASSLDSSAISTTSTSTTTSTTTTTTTAKPVPSTTIAEAVEPANATVAAIATSPAPAATTVAQPTTFATVTTTSSPSTTSTTTTTTTVAPIPQTTSKKPSKAATLPARFGRLVIKRGDKVVARFNASEPIPDSVIPVGNGSLAATEGIIVPDMPRLAMRRSFKKKVQPQAEIWSPNRQLEATNATSSNGTESKSAPAEARRFRKSLSREPRSYLEDLADDLLTSDSAPDLTEVANSNRTSQAARSIRSRERNNWSARLRDSVGKPVADKKYDPEEDLKKLVEKISAIERRASSTSAPTITTGAPSTTSPSPPTSERATAVESSQRPTVAPSIQTTQATSVANSTATSSPAKLNATMAVARSSSVSFTVTLSPDLKRQWEKLKPVQGLGAPGTAQEARINSHGHIHVRNNQSITVHVDVPPPNRNQSANFAKLASGDKKVDSKVQLAARDDLHRLSRPTRSHVTHKTQPIDVNRLASRTGVQDSEQDLASDESRQQPAKPRKPRMLCIEVDAADERELQRLPTAGR